FSRSPDFLRAVASSQLLPPASLSTLTSSHDDESAPLVTPVSISKSESEAVSGEKSKRSTPGFSRSGALTMSRCGGFGFGGGGGVCGGGGGWGRRGGGGGGGGGGGVGGRGGGRGGGGGGGGGGRRGGGGGGRRRRRGRRWWWWWWWWWWRWRWWWRRRVRVAL